jgi:hypothetical protein
MSKLEPIAVCSDQNSVKAAKTRGSEVVILLIRAMRLHSSEKRRDENRLQDLTRSFGTETS